METRKCNVCGKENYDIKCNSLSINLDLLNPFEKRDISWKILDICEKCFPDVVEKINAFYEEIIGN